jgi:signal transduction histidine kinase
MDGSGIIDHGALILVIDDEPTQRMLSREALEQRGYRVEEAESGEAGLLLAQKLKPALILLDVMMPGMDGFEVCRQIRSDPDLNRTPVVIVTALEDLESIETGFKAGATDFIAKPIVWPLLGYRLQFALRAAEMETDLVLARDDAEQTSTAKSVILANMGHELRTPLNAIIGFSEYLRDQAQTEDANEQSVEFLGDICFSGKRLLSTVNDILEMANLEAGRVELDETIIDLSRLLAGVVEKHQSAAGEKGITLDARAAKDALLVVGDYDVLRRAIGRIVSNAVKFTPSGGVYVAAMHRPTGEVEISITDSGVGMTAAEISSIVEPFRQADNSLSREQEGSGLGVPLAKAVLKLHKGELEIKSEPGVGTTVSIILPAEAYRTGAPETNSTDAVTAETTG